MYNRYLVKKASEWQEPKGVDASFEEEHKYHKGLMTSGREQAVQNLAQHYTMRAFGEDPENPSGVKLRHMMGEYFYYLKRYDRDFLRRLRDLVKELIIKFTKNPQQLEQMLAQQQPAAPAEGAGAPPPDAGGGGIPQLASTRTAGRLFLNREDAGYRLKGTLAGRIFQGKQHYVDENGVDRIMSVAKDVSVPMTGPTAKMALKIDEELPSALWSAASKYLAEQGVPDAEYAARSLVNDYVSKGAFDLRPISIRFSSPAFGFLLYRDVKGVSEPPETQGLRKAIGEAMSPFIKGLKSAMDMEGIKEKDLAARMPEHARNGQGPEDRYPTRDPGAISSDRVSKSLDVKSLVMTLASQESDDSIRAAAADRLVDIIVRHPGAYEKNKLDANDMRRISRLARCPGDNGACRNIDRLARFVDLFDADDASLLEAYGGAEEDQGLIATMVAKQGRSSVVNANPAIAVGQKINAAYLSGIDEEDEQGAEALKQAMGLVLSGQEKPSRVLVDKFMRAMYRNPDRTMIEQALNSNTMARDMAVALLLERGSPEEKQRALSYIQDYRKSFGSKAPTLLAISVVKGLEGDPSSMGAAKALGVSPETISKFLGRQPALQYMRAARVGWDGNGLPSASEIHSLTDDPLPLLKNYFELAREGDKNALAALHRMYHLMSTQQASGHAFTYLQDAMSHLEQDTDMLGELSPPKEEPQPVIAKVLPDGSVIIKRGGAYSVEGTDICFSCAPQDATRIAVAALGKARETRPRTVFT